MTDTIVNFQVHGDFITNHFRNIVREGNWKKASTDLKKSLINIPYEYVYAVLSGEKKFEGINSLDLVDDDISNNVEWINSQYFSYFNNLFLINNSFYKIYNRISSFNDKDIKNIKEKFQLNRTPVPINSDEKFLLNQLIANSYLNSNYDLFLYFNSEWIFLKSVEPDFPIWLEEKFIKNHLFNKGKDISDEYQEQYDFFNNFDIESFLEQFKKDNTILDNALDNFIENQIKIKNLDIEQLKLEISENADKRGGWLEFENPSTGKKFKIPKNPFLKWCLSDNPLYKTIDWNAISPSGFKGAGDDPNHTDWFLFTGIELEQAQNIYSEDISFLFNKREETFKKYTQSNIFPLVRGKHKGFKKAKIIHISNSLEFNLLKPNSVIVVPNADPDFENIANYCAKNNSILVSETGGKLCHLATVGREFGLTLYMLNNAKKLLPNGSTVKFNTEEDIISIYDYEDEEFISILQAKINGDHYK